MSKFDYSGFYGGYDELAVSKEKYTKEQAIEIAKVELERNKKPYYIAVGEGSLIENLNKKTLPYDKAVKIVEILESE